MKMSQALEIVEEHLSEDIVIAVATVTGNPFDTERRTFKLKLLKQHPKLAGQVMYQHYMVSDQILEDGYGAYVAQKINEAFDRVEERSQHVH